MANKKTEITAGIITGIVAAGITAVVLVKRNELHEKATQRRIDDMNDELDYLLYTLKTLRENIEEG